MHVFTGFRCLPESGTNGIKPATDGVFENMANGIPLNWDLFPFVIGGNLRAVTELTAPAMT